MQQRDEMTSFTSLAPRIAFDDGGHGHDALLFLPGWCTNRTVFRPVLERVAQTSRAIALDWRGHGESESVEGDFGAEALVTDALRVIEAAGVRRVVPVALAHGGWVAIELVRRLGARAPKLVLLEWIVTAAPPPFLSALAAMQDPQRWRATVDRVFESWLAGTDNAALTYFVRDEMGSYGFAMWSRGGREIAAAYAQNGSPLEALARMESRPVLHMFADAYEPPFVEAQRVFAESDPWYSFQVLLARAAFLPSKSLTRSPAP
jgi:pimeloyl-ACP methyl ester carboxylesterase